MCIDKIEVFTGEAGYYVEDHAAIKKGAKFDGHFSYEGKPITRGFKMIKQPAKTLSFILSHNGGQKSYGDAMSVQYSASSGREGVFDPSLFHSETLEKLNKALAGKQFYSFREACFYLEEKVSLFPYAIAMAYGLSQALLTAFSKVYGRVPAQVICEEYGVRHVLNLPLVLCQTDVHSISEIDKMIMKDANILPHANFNCVERFGEEGGLFLKYVNGVLERIKKYETDGIGDCRYLHFDLYGVLGEYFENKIDAISLFLLNLEEKVKPLSLQIETPILGCNKDHHWSLMAELHRILHNNKSKIQLVIDEWCNNLDDIRSAIASGIADIIHIKTPDMGSLHNSIEAVLLCNSSPDIKAYLGGSSNETEISAKATAHVAVATGPYQILAKPGMGINEGSMIIKNEMKRALLSLN